MNSVLALLCLLAPCAQTEYLKPAEAQKWMLTQTYYELDDGTRAEQHEFLLEEWLEFEEKGTNLVTKRTLYGWMIGDIRLDSIKDPKPVVARLAYFSPLRMKPDLHQAMAVEEFRTDRLRFMAIPKDFSKLKSWSEHVKEEPLIGLPAIDYTFSLRSGSAQGKVVVSVKAKEADAPNAVSAQGEVELEIANSAYRIVKGTWTTPSTFMVGSMDEKFKLVQQLAEPPRA